MKNIYKVLFAWLLVFIITDNKGSSQPKEKVDRFKLLRNNGTKYTFEKVERDEDLEYPGQDEKLLQVLQKKWSDYYKCLELKQNETKKPELRRLIEGQNTEFECNVCVRPFQNYEELEWRYKPLSQDSNITELELLDLTPEMELLPNKTLKIFNLVRYFEGLYACFHGRDPVSAFVLEISSNDTIERVTSAYERTTKSPLLLNGSEFIIQYHWGKWSECSSCGTVGRKYRYATCFVLPKNAPETQNQIKSRNLRRRLLLSKDDLIQKNLMPKTKNVTKKITDIYYKIRNSTSEGEESFDWEPEIITKFSNGVPCASPYLPVAALKQIKNYKAAKAIVKFCQELCQGAEIFEERRKTPKAVYLLFQELCQGAEIFEVEDRFGNVIETANNSAGIYSMYQKLPHLPPAIERVSITGELGKDIILQCPGTSLTNTPVTWAVNKKIIFPEVIANQSNGRFVIDLVNRISLKKLRLKDSHTYSCWQKGKLIGTVHLEVEKKLKITFNHHITLLGVAAVIGTFLFVGTKVLTRKLNSKRK